MLTLLSSLETKRGTAYFITISKWRFLAQDQNCFQWNWYCDWNTRQGCHKWRSWFGRHVWPVDCTISIGKTSQTSLYGILLLFHETYMGILNLFFSWSLNVLWHLFTFYSMAQLFFMKKCTLLVEITTAATLMISRYVIMWLIIMDVICFRLRT